MPIHTHGSHGKLSILVYRSPPHFFLSRSLSLNLELDWLSVRPSNPPASAPHGAGVTVAARFLCKWGGLQLRCSCSHWEYYYWAISQAIFLALMAVVFIYFDTIEYSVHCQNRRSICTVRCLLPQTLLFTMPFMLSFAGWNWWPGCDYLFIHISTFALSLFCCNC